MSSLNKHNIIISLLCSSCGNNTSKSVSYIERRIKQNKKNFYCSRKCADYSHSERMTGDKNPNFEGKFHGLNPKDCRTEEEMKEHGLRTIEIMRANGDFDARMKKLHEGHKKFFSTDEGKRVRSRNGIKSVLKQSKGMRTSIEIKMAQELNRRGIEYEEQRNLGDKFVLDFFLPEFNIVIECDGDYWHNLPKNKARDKQKNAYIKACGLPLFRFWEHEINSDIEACVDLVIMRINENDVG